MKIFYQATAIFLGSTVTEEGTVFGIRNLMVLVANFSAHCADTNAIHHLTCVTMVPAQGVSKLEMTAPQRFCKQGFSQISTAREFRLKFWKGKTLTSVGSWTLSVWWWRCRVCYTENLHPAQEGKSFKPVPDTHLPTLESLDLKPTPLLKTHLKKEILAPHMPKKSRHQATRG